MIDEGIVQALDLTQMLQGTESKLAHIRRLAAGYWPISSDGRGNLDDGATLFKGVADCQTIESDNIGCYLVEDMASLARILLTHLSEKEEGTGFKHAYTIAEEDLSIGGLQMGHYGLVQKEIHRLTQFGFNTLPIDHFIMTSLVGEGTDKRERTKMFGPQMTGSASTAEIPSWFGDCFYLREMPIIIEDSEGKQTTSSQRVLHFKDFLPDEDGIPYKAKLRIMPELVKQVEAKYPEGYVELTPEKGIIPFLNFLERIKKAYRDTLLAAALQAGYR